MSSTCRTASGAIAGCKLLEKEQQVEEHLVLEFHGDTKIYVPASKIELVQKYVGGSEDPADAGPHRRADLDASRKRPPRKRSSIWPPTCCKLQAARALRPGISFRRRHALAARVRRLVSLHRNARPVDVDRGHQGRHGAAAADGPAAVRRRRLRQDRTGDAGGVQGGRQRLPGGGARADDDPGRAAPAHVYRAHGRVSRSRFAHCRDSARPRSRKPILEAWPTGRSTS